MSGWRVGCFRRHWWPEREEGSAAEYGGVQHSCRGEIEGGQLVWDLEEEEDIFLYFFSIYIYIF